MKIKFNILKKVFLLFLCFITIISLASCTAKHADNWDDFQHNQFDEKYNAIIVDFEENNKITFFMEEQYGIWEKNGHTELVYFSFQHLPATHGDTGTGDVEIRLITLDDYYRYVIEEYPFPPAEKIIFGASAETIQYSADKTIATITSNEWWLDEISEKSWQSLTLKKVLLPSNQIVPLKESIAQMKYVPDTYFEFLDVKSENRYVCETANFWVDATTKIGQWETNGTIVPIEMNISEKVPYVEIYDISNTEKVLIFKAYANVQSNTSLTIDQADVDKIFYAKPDQIEINKIGG